MYDREGLERARAVTAAFATNTRVDCFPNIIGETVETLETEMHEFFFFKNEAHVCRYLSRWGLRSSWAASDRSVRRLVPRARVRAPARANNTRRPAFCFSFSGIGGRVGRQVGREKSAFETASVCAHRSPRAARVPPSSANLLSNTGLRQGGTCAFRVMAICFSCPAERNARALAGSFALGDDVIIYGGLDTIDDDEVEAPAKKLKTGEE